MIPLVNPAHARHASAASQPWLPGPIHWIVVVLALVATADATYLTWTSFTHGVVAGCSGAGQAGCDEVLTSRWSRAAGMPVALGGLACYAAILALGVAAGSRVFNANPWLGTALATMAILAAASGIWFTLLQIFALRAFCYYCLGIHLCGLSIAALVLWSALGKSQHQTAASRSHVALAAAISGVPGLRRTAGPRPAEGPSLHVAGPIAGALLCLLITAQILFPPQTFDVSQPALAETIDMTAASDTSPAATDELSPDAHPHTVNRVTDSDPAAADEQVEPLDNESAATEQSTSEEPVAEQAPALSRPVTFLDGKIRLNIYDEAVLGSPEAKYVVLELMDYTCPHCRKMHAQIHEALERYGDQLAVVVMPVPLELECNKMVTSTDPMHRGACKISRLALAFAKADPAKFVDFHDFLLADPDKPPTATQAVVRAFHLTDRTKLSKLSKDKAVEARLQKYINLFSTLSAQHKEKASTFGLPVQIVGDTVLAGDMTSEEMFAAWEKALGIKPQ